MKKYFGILVASLSIYNPLIGNDSQTKALYNSLDPASIAQLLAFYEAYSDIPDAEQALLRAWQLLTQSQNICLEGFDLDLNRVSQQLINGIIGLINRESICNSYLTSKELQIIEKLGDNLANRKLMGYNAKTESEVINLKPEDVDLARALLLSQIGSDAEAMIQIRSYEAMLDLMSLQIQARLAKQECNEKKIEVINQFIFEEMHFRFPPQSKYAKDIDLYTFLPSVLDQHLGVCLGVATLYLCLAQRLALPLEVITPPGHIYVRYREPGKKEINIETTARGVNMQTDTYLGVNTRSLELRNLKEVVGMTHVNQASVYLHRKNYEQAIKSYEKALPYMPHDPMAVELLGYSYLLYGNQEKAKELLAEVQTLVPETVVVRQNTAEDYLNGKIDALGIEAMFMEVDKNRESILKKIHSLEAVIAQFPDFRSGLYHLAVAWLQLNRSKEARDILLRYHQLDPNDPTVEYYLAAIFAERLDYAQAWYHLNLAENITNERNFQPKALKELRHELTLRCPPNP